MLTTILRPSSVWCGKEKEKKNRHFENYRKKTKSLLFINRVCVWQHLFTFIQYKFSFPCVQMLTFHSLQAQYYTTQVFLVIIARFLYWICARLWLPLTGPVD